MSNCPYCQQQIEIKAEQYGQLTFPCPHCGNSFGIGFFGEILMPDANDQAPQDLIPTTDIETPEVVVPAPEYNFEVNQEPVPDVTPVEVPTAKDMLEDVVEFANNNVNFNSQTYTLTISGIDSGTVHKELKDALTDSKLNLNSEQLLASIKFGELKIPRISPLITSIILSRIRFLPVEISWSQDD